MYNHPIGLKHYFSTLLRKLKIPLLLLLIGLIGHGSLFVITTYFVYLPFRHYPLFHHALNIAFTLFNFAGVFIALFKMITVTINALQIFSQKNNRNKIFSLILPITNFFLKIITLLFALYTLTTYFNFSETYENIFANIIKITLISGVAIVIIKTIIGYEKLFSELWAQDLNSGNTRVRQFYTKLHIVRQVLVTIVFILAIAMIFMVFDSVRKIGVGILASAGIASAIIGFSAQKSLANIVSCLQLAFSEMIKIGDQIIIDNETGEIEEITLTYVVIKLWNLQRYVFPISYLNEKPIKIISRSTEHQVIGVVFLAVDYNLPIEELRQEFMRLLEQNPNWDKKIASLEVTDAQKNKMEIRLSMSVKNNNCLWALQCEVREKMVDYIVQNYPNSMLTKNSVIDNTQEK